MNPPRPLRVFSPDESIPASAADRDDAADAMSEAELDRELQRLAGDAAPETVAITLGQMVPLLMDAANKNRVWLTDFSDEVIRIDADLYEVLLAYGRMRSREAA